MCKSTDITIIKFLFNNLILNLLMLKDMMKSQLPKLDLLSYRNQGKG